MKLELAEAQEALNRLEVEALDRKHAFSWEKLRFLILLLNSGPSSPLSECPDEDSQPRNGSSKYTLLRRLEIK
jgi:hypothetical protein